MNNIDLILIAKSEMLDYNKYKALPYDRIELFRDLTQLKMVYFENGFRSQLDLLNRAMFGKYFYDVDYAERAKMFSTWNMQSLNPYLALTPLINDGFSCKVILNLDAEFDKLLKYTESQEKKYIAVSTTFMLTFAEVSRVVKKIKASIPDAIIILGGAFINDNFGSKKLDYIKSLKKYGINYVLTAFNSEFDFLDLMKTLRQNSSLDKVNNLIYLDNDTEYKITQEKWNEPNLEQSPIPWDKIEFDTNVSMIQMRTTSGCPFTCSFCTYPVSANGYHKDEPELILRPQLEKLKKLGHIKSIIFIDDTPNIPQKRFEKILDILKDYDFRWYSFLRVQYIDDNIARKMKESGCDGVYLGIESADDEVLKNMNKAATRKKYEKGIALLNKYSIESLVAFIIGFPGETRESVANNISFIAENKINFYSLKEFFYMHTAPIHAKKEKFELDGWGNNWSHKTMNSIEASKLKLESYDSMKQSLYVDADTSLWYLAYLRDMGFSWPDIKGIQAILNEMMQLDNLDKFDCLEKEELFAKLKNIVDKLPRPTD